MVKNLQCLKIPQICYLKHAERHSKNRTSLRGLDHDTLFFLNDALSTNGKWFLGFIEQKKTFLLAWN